MEAFIFLQKKKEIKYCQNNVFVVNLTTSKQEAEELIHSERGGIIMYKFNRLNLYLEQFSGQVFIGMLLLGTVLFSDEICEALNHGIIYVAEITRLLSC